MILLVLIMLVLIVFGMPVAFALGVGALGALLAEPSLPVTLVPQRMFTALDSWPIMAVPLFMLAGGLMDKGGMSRRIVEFANRFADRGEDVTIYHPTGESCSWMECRACTLPSSRFLEQSHDVVIFNEPHYYRIIRRTRAQLKVHYVLGLYDRHRLVSYDPRILWPWRGRSSPYTAITEVNLTPAG